MYPSVRPWGIFKSPGRGVRYIFSLRVYPCTPCDALLGALPRGPRVTPEPLYLTAEDVAELLQVSKSTVFRMARRDRTMPALMLGGVVRFPRERLLLWLRQREQGTVPRPRSIRAGVSQVGHVDGHTTGSGEAAEVGGDR